MARAVLVETFTDADGDIQAGRALTFYERDGTTPFASPIFKTATGSSTYGPSELVTDTNGEFVGYTTRGCRVQIAVAGRSTKRVSHFFRDPTDDSVYVTDFGAVPDGTTDSTAAIQAAFDTGGTVYVPVEEGEVGYKITSTLRVGNGSATAQSTIPRCARIIGVGGGVGLFTDYVVGVSGVKIETDIDGYAGFFWYGANDGTMLEVLGPIQNVEISGLGFDCRAVASCAVRTWGMQNSVLRQLKAIRNINCVATTGDERTETAAYDIRCYAASDADPNSDLISDNGGNGCTFVGLYHISGAARAAGFAVGSPDVPDLDGTNPDYPSEAIGPDISQCKFINCISRTTNGVGSTGFGVALALRYTDALSFDQCSFTGACQVSVEVPANADGSNGLRAFPNYIKFSDVHIDSGTHGFDTCRIIGTWTAEQKILFCPLVTSLDHATNANIVNFGYGWTTRDAGTDRSGLIGNWKAGGSFVVGTTLDVIGSATARSGLALSFGIGVGEGQIAFPSVQNPSAVANTLDDYEEGPWSPILSGATTATYTAQTGRYTKIGRHVFFSCNFIVNSRGDGSQTVIAGLPFAVGGPMAVEVGYFSGSATNVVSVAGYNTGSGSTITLTSKTVAGAASEANNVFTNSTQVILSGHYIV